MSPQKRFSMKGLDRPACGARHWRVEQLLLPQKCNAAASGVLLQNLNKLGGVFGPSMVAWLRYSERQYPHPLAVQNQANGLRLFYPGPAITGNSACVCGWMPASTDGGSNNTYTLANVPGGATETYRFTIGVAAGGATETAWVTFTK